MVVLLIGLVGVCALRSVLSGTLMVKLQLGFIELLIVDRITALWSDRSARESPFLYGGCSRDE